MNLLFEVLQNHRVTCRYSGHSGGKVERLLATGSSRGIRLAAEFRMTHPPPGV